MSKIYFISDTHFNHKMLIEGKKRSFKTVEDMNNFIIKNWNKTILDEDIIYHLGDVALNKKVDYENNILPELKGQKIFIQGNHDPQNISTTQNIIIKYQGILIELVHRPEDATKHTKIVLHGHIHKSGIRSMKPKGDYIKEYIFKDLEGRFYYNCNLEYHKYKPKPLSEILGDINLIKESQVEEILSLIRNKKAIHISDLEKELPKCIRIAELGEILGILKSKNIIKKTENIVSLLDS